MEYEGSAVCGKPEGTFTVNRQPREFSSVEQYIRSQGRFRALTDAEVKAVEETRDVLWRRLEAKRGE